MGRKLVVDSTHISAPRDVPYELPAGYELEPGRGVMLRRGGANAILFNYGLVLLTEMHRPAEILSRYHGVEMLGRTGLRRLCRRRDDLSSAIRRPPARTPELAPDTPYRQLADRQEDLGNLYGLGIERAVWLV